MSATTEQIMQTSTDRREVMKAAMQLARSAEPKDSETLSRYLRSADFLKRLDSSEDYANATKRTLAVVRVINTLASNISPAAKQLIVVLTGDKTFMAEADRVDALVRASASVRPPPPELVSFWRSCLNPDEAYTYLLTKALLENATQPALTVFGEYLNSPHYETEEKRFILYTDLLPQRYHPVVVDFADRALRGAIQQDLRVPLIEALFDYRPAEWYLVHGAVEEPPMASANPASLAQLRRIGEYALQHVVMPDALKAVVKHAIAEMAKRVP